MEEKKDETSNQATASSTTDTPVVAQPGKAPISEDMHVKVYSPFHTYFDDRAKSISALNATGPFDILPGHRNFMTLVSACELIIRTTNGEEKIKIARAVMHVKADDVRVFLDV